MTTETYPAPIERKIARKLIEDALAQGYEIDVFDGEEYPLRNGDSVAKIEAAMFSTDEDRLEFCRPGARCAGWVHLIYGNGADLISDCSYNEATRAIIAGAEALAETLDA